MFSIRALPGRHSINRRRAGVVAITALACLAAGCTPTRLEHPVFGQSHLDADSLECARLARAQADRLSFYDFGPPAVVPYRAPNGTIYYRWANPFPYRNRAFDEQMLRSECLRFKGYRAVPLDQAGRDTSSTPPESEAPSVAPADTLSPSSPPSEH